MRTQRQASGATSRLFADLLNSAIAQLRRAGGGAGRDAVLYLGQRHQAFPALLISDPILEPVDKIVWMTIWQRGAGGSAQAPFPSYAEISANAQIRSDTTIARALAVLRATRWLSLCARVRGDRGKFRGHVYAVHDEPLPLRDAVQLDPEYFRFLEAAQTHPHPRVCKIAIGVLTALKLDVQGGIDVTAPTHPITRRLEALRAVAHPGVFRYFDFTPDVLRNLVNTADQERRFDRLQDLETVDPLQILEMVCSSSSNNNKYKTTTTQSETPATAREAALVYPRGLNENQRALACHYLALVPVTQRQSVLDELEGRLRAARKGASPVYDPLRYLHRLCLEFAQGRFVSNLGSEVDAERLRLAAQSPPAPRAPAPPDPPASPEPLAEKSPGKTPVAGILAQFNLRSRRRSPT